jgi:hypothetical protein
MPARIGELAHTFSYKIQYAGARMLFMPVNKNGATCRSASQTSVPRLCDTSQVKKSPATNPAFNGRCSTQVDSLVKLTQRRRDDAATTPRRRDAATPLVIRHFDAST